MATQPTQNVVPSESPRDLKFNSGKIDEFVTSMGWTYTDRFGQKHYTIEGMRWLAQQAIAAFGYITLDSFEDGNTLTLPNQVLRLEATGEYYRWDGPFPKDVPENSTPETSGGIGPGKWLSVGDSSLRSDLASGGKSALVGYEDTTVEGALDDLYSANAAQSSKTGFDTVGRFLNLTELRAQAPSSAGMIVYVASAASSTATEKHYGGGYFQSFNNATSPVADDGGVYIIPLTGTIGWKRILFNELDMTFWGVKPDSGIDNSAEILKAMTYVRSKKTTIRFPAGVVTSTQALPIWSECAIVGHGREVSQFVKTTNNGWPVASGVNIDALCVCLPDVYNPSGFTMDTFCMRPRIKGISLRRGSLTFANRSAYGIWGHKLAQSHFSDMLVLGANYGFYSINCFLMIQEQVSYSGVVGSYAGVYIANALTGAYGRSGTTCSFMQVSVSGYNFGFFIAGLDSTRLTQCDAEGISLAAGESVACAYSWINPMNCMMDCCYTEGVNGIMLRAINANNVSIANSLVVNCFNITPGETFTSPTRLMSIDSASLGTLKVTFIGGDIRNNVPGAGNMLPPIASGSNCVVKLIGGLSNPWDLSGGATYTEI